MKAQGQDTQKMAILRNTSPDPRDCHCDGVRAPAFGSQHTGLRATPKAVGSRKSRPAASSHRPETPQGNPPATSDSHPLTALEDPPRPPTRTHPCAPGSLASNGATGGGSPRTATRGCSGRLGDGEAPRTSGSSVHISPGRSIMTPQSRLEGSDKWHGQRVCAPSALSCSVHHRRTLGCGKDQASLCR